MAKVEATKASTTPVAAASNEPTPVPTRIERWARSVLTIAARRALRPKRLQPKFEEFTKANGAEAYTFFIVHGGRSGKPVVRFEGTKGFINAKFFGPKGGFRKGITKDERSELKAAIFSAFAYEAVGGTYSKPYYRMMVRCTWKGTAAGAIGSEKPARDVLKKKSQNKVAEVATGTKERASLWCLTCSANKTLDADIFIANGCIKVARGKCPDCSHNLRMMLKGAKATPAKPAAKSAAPAKAGSKK